MSTIATGFVRRRPKTASALSKNASTRNRRSMALAASGVLCVLLGSLGFVAVEQSINDRVAVLAIDRPVALGDRIQSSDLREVRVSADPSLRLVGARRRSEVVGATATMPMAQGSLLTEDQWRSNGGMPTGKAILGVSLKGAQLPTELHGGDHVSVIDTSVATPTVLVSDAVVFATPTKSDVSGTTVASLLVGVEVAPQVTSAAAAGKVSLVLLGVGP